MKKLLSILIAALMLTALFSFVSCKKDDDDKKSGPNTNYTSVTEEEWIDFFEFKDISSATASFTIDDTEDLEVCEKTLKFDSELLYVTASWSYDGEEEGSYTYYEQNGGYIDSFLDISWELSGAIESFFDDLCDSDGYEYYDFDYNYNSCVYNEQGKFYYFPEYYELDVRMYFGSDKRLSKVEVSGYDVVYSETVTFYGYNSTSVDLPTREISSVLSSHSIPTSNVEVDFYGNRDSDNYYCNEANVIRDLNNFMSSLNLDWVAEYEAESDEFGTYYSIWIEDVNNSITIDGVYFEYTTAEIEFEEEDGEFEIDFYFSNSQGSMYIDIYY